MPSRSDTAANQALNEILVILHRSLPAYLSHAAPWVAFGEEESHRVLARVVTEREDHVHRLSELLDARRHVINRGEFPMDFTSLHDVSLDFLIKQLIHEERQNVARIEACERRLTGDREGRTLAAEALAIAQRHLRWLETMEPQEPVGAADQAPPHTPQSP
jgi:hypothetical protein